MKNIEKNPSVPEYSIMYCTISSWILGVHGDREWVMEGVIWLKHDIHRPEVPRQNFLGLSIYTIKKMKGRKLK
jgi:hypothetical protein